MARSQNRFMKLQREKIKRKKKEDKEQRKKERLENNAKGGSLDDMIAYVDEFGQIIDTPPEEEVKKDSDEEDEK